MSPSPFRTFPFTIKNGLRISGLAGVLSSLVLACAGAATVETEKDVDAVISDSDSLQDVFPTINQRLSEGRVAASLVDGPSVPDVAVPTQGNSVVLRHDNGPVFITWDLGEEARSKHLQLDRLDLVLVGVESKKMDHYLSHLPNFVGRVAVSKDGENYETIKGSEVTLIAPNSKEANVIHWKFAPGEVADFRYLRVESDGYENKSARIAEIDGWITGGEIAKSFEIHSSVAQIAAGSVTRQTPAISQAQSAPAVVQPLEISSGKLVLKKDGRSILNIEKLLTVAGTDWSETSRKSDARSFAVELRRKDGLLQSRTMRIDDECRVAFDVKIHLPDSAPPVEYSETPVIFSEAEVKFDGVTFGGVPSFVKRENPASVELGEWTPYFILPNRELGVELQVFMPAWYDVIGRVDTFSPQGALSWTLYPAAKNRSGDIDEEAAKQNRFTNKWIGQSRQIKPGAPLSYHWNLMAFDITPMTLGQNDIEMSGMLPLTGIDTGLPNQKAPGVATVLQRDKMIFMGFKLREPLKEKLGHLTVDTTGVYTQPGVIERLKKAGVGASVLMADEYVDVSHGVSKDGKYDQHQPFLPEVLAKLTAQGIKPLFWFSPRGFLNEPWLGRPRDPLLDAHPEWFLKSSHWFGRYQTMDSYNEVANEWVIGKFNQDLKEFAELKGFAFDSFPLGGTVVGGPEGRTLRAQDQLWLQRFTKAIHAHGNDYMAIMNGTPPIFDDHLNVDYIVTEHFPLMFLNEVLGGRAFGKPFIAHIQWRQLYGWYVTLGNMYYNFCDYDQALGWMHMVHLGWTDAEVKASPKPVDDQVIPLWYIMGKGVRTYAAEIAPDVRQIEARMPDGTVVVTVASISSWRSSVEVVPQTVTPGIYQVECITDTGKDHKVYSPEKFDSKKMAGFRLKDAPAFSITTFRFRPNP